MSAAWGSNAKVESLRYSRIMMYAWFALVVPAVVVLALLLRGK